MNFELEPLDNETRNQLPKDAESKFRETIYTGVEHRHGPRRIKADRREMLRFELDKKDRRSDVDRRRGGRWNNISSL